MGVGFGVQRGVSVLQLLFQTGLPVAQFQPFVEYGGFLPGLFVILGEKSPDLLQTGGDVGLVHLIQRGEDSILAAVFLL
jgi:hypothetical protein